MKETQTTFDLEMGSTTSVIALNNDILDDFEELKMTDPKEGIEVSSNNQVSFETNIDSELSKSIAELDREIQKHEDTLDLAQKNIEVGQDEEINITTSDLKQMDEIGISEMQAETRVSPVSLASNQSVTVASDAGYGNVNILTIGIGGCGVNTIGRMFDESQSAIKLVALDTSRKSLDTNNAHSKILLGEKYFNGHGSGSEFDKVALAINDEKKRIEELLTGIDMLFITGGIGKGTGSVGLVEIGKIARQMDILTIGFGVLPKSSEADGQVVRKYYSDFIENVDSNIIIENERVSEVYKHLPVLKAAKKADMMLVDGIRGISELITSTGKINLDYADVKTAFSNKGSVVMGIGYGKGENAVVDAIENSINTEIINFNDIKNARDIIFNISCAKNTITIGQADEGTKLIYSYNVEDQIDHLFFGYSYDESLNDEVKVTFVATGTGGRNLDDISYLDTGIKANAKDDVPRDLFGEPIKKRSKTIEKQPAEAANTETKTLELPDFFQKN